MMGKINRFSFVIVLVAVVATAGVAFGQFEPGQLVVTTAGGATGVFVGGTDVTDLCVGPYCNGNGNTGTDGLDYNVILGYSPGPMENQWLFFNIFGTEGVDIVEGVFADPGDCPLCTERMLSLVGGEWSIDYGPSLGIPQATGQIVAISPDGTFPEGGAFIGVVVPEPATGLLSLLGLALFAIRRR